MFRQCRDNFPYEDYFEEFATLATHQGGADQDFRCLAVAAVLKFLKSTVRGNIGAPLHLIERLKAPLNAIKKNRTLFLILPLDHNSIMELLVWSGDQQLSDTKFLAEMYGYDHASALYGPP